MAKHQGPFADDPPFQNGAGFLALDLPLHGTYLEGSFLSHLDGFKKNRGSSHLAATAS